MKSSVEPESGSFLSDLAKMNPASVTAIEGELFSDRKSGFARGKYVQAANQPFIQDEYLVEQPRG